MSWKKLLIPMRRERDSRSERAYSLVRDRKMGLPARGLTIGKRVLTARNVALIESDKTILVLAKTVAVYVGAEQKACELASACTG